MICQECNVDCPCGDFLMHNVVCYHCVYKNKLKVIKCEEKEKKELECKMCGKKFRIDTNKRIRQRNIYCSRECALRSHKIQMQNFWTNKIKLDLIFR